ncbi:MAG: shikimate kinase [Cellvibrionaceae bacterium]
MNCISLIGMPGAGKSTLGIMLAKSLAKNFVDTDVLIQTRSGQHLQDIIDNQGYLTLRILEEQVLLDLEVSNSVIATGGSAVYSRAGMKRLKSLGVIVYLDVSFNNIEERITNFSTRGLACAPGQSLKEIYEERTTLYKNAADIIIASSDGSPEKVLNRLETELANYN